MNPRVNKTVIDNGVRILTKTFPHVHSVSMGVWVNVGARDESAEESGLSHLIEHMIFKGTAKRTAYQIAKEFDAIGGQTNAFTSMELTCYHARVMDSHLATMVDILSDIFLHSEFDQKEVERERAVILQEIGMVEDTPEEHVHTLLGNSFWGDNPLGRSILGTRENVRGFSAETIRDFFNRNYQPDRIVISAAGNLTHDHFVDLVGGTFESVRPGNGFPERLAPQPKAATAVHRRELEQVHLCLGTPGLSTTDSRRYALSLLNTILGGNMSSRLFQEIREQRGLAYAVYSYICSHADTGMFGVYAGVAPENTFAAVELILEALRRMRREPVGEAELQDAKEYTKGGVLLSAESMDNQMVRIAQNEINFGRDIPLPELIDKISSVTVEEVHQAAQQLLESGKIALTMLGPVPDEASHTDAVLELMSRS
ncbi:MAG: M16 family metallopeptidase [Thermodesulfobacteriota bacterium]